MANLNELNLDDLLADLPEITQKEEKQEEKKQASSSVKEEKQPQQIDIIEESIEEAIESTPINAKPSGLSVVGGRRRTNTTQTNKAAAKAEKMQLIEQLKKLYPIELFDPSKINGIHYKYELEGEQIKIVNLNTNKILKTISNKFRWLSPILFQQAGYEIKDLVAPKPGMLEFTAVKDNIILVIADSYTPERKGAIRVIINGEYKGMEQTEHDIIKFHKIVSKFLKVAQTK